MAIFVVPIFVIPINTSRVESYFITIPFLVFLKKILRLCLTRNQYNDKYLTVVYASNLLHIGFAGKYFQGIYLHRKASNQTEKGERLISYLIEQ